MKAKVLFLAMAFGGSWAQVQAEPAVQAGDTLESLSQVKIKKRKRGSFKTKIYLIITETR